MKEKLTNLLNNFYQFVEKIGKRNFMLLTFIVIVLIITGLYTTFSLYTSSEGLSILEGIKTYKFILGPNNTENSVTVAAGTSKNIAITVTNNDKIKLKYGVYYSSTDDLTDIELGYKWDTDYLPNGVIEPSKDYVVTIQIDNNSTNNVTIKFGILYGVENGGDLVLGENQHFLEKKWHLSLNEVEPGSYVAYTGTNGCPDGHCDGTNANYVSDTDMGYCNNSDYKFSVNGWRVGYVKDGSAYLVSAGAPECMCTDSSGNASSSGCSNFEKTIGAPQHLANLDSKALTYCNPNYAYGGTCNSSSAWAMKADDFKAITGSALSSSSCFNISSDPTCGYGNDLIDNGGYYWYATPYSSSSTVTFVWVPSNRNVINYYSNSVHGARPVLRLASTVQVVGGSGTYEDPYRISPG